jgi:hypothetical protein
MFFADSNGNYLGSFDGGDAGEYWDGEAWGAPPAGVVAVPSQPAVAGQTWNGSAWVDTSTSLTNKAQATYNGLINGGLAITSASTPALNGTYDVSIAGQQRITAMQAAILTSAALFPGYWHPTLTGAPVTMTVAQFTEIAEAALAFVAECVAALSTITAGGTATFPSASATVA